jgi:hypothetical protein
MRAGPAIVTVVVALSACVQVIGLDDLHTFDDDGGTGDATVADGQADAGFDVLLPPSDAGNETMRDAPLGDGAMNAGNFSCASLNPQPAVCDDFDEGVIAGRWTTVTNFGSVMLDPTVASSTPNSIAATIDQIDDGQVGQAMLTTNIPLGGATFIDFAADVRLDTFGVNGALVSGVGTPNASPALFWTPRFTPNGDGLRFTQDLTKTDYAASQMFIIDEWLRVRLTIHFTTATPPSALTELYFGPDKVLSVTLTNVSLPDSIDVFVGFQTIVGPTVGKSLVNVDNVTVDVR